MKSIGIGLTTHDRNDILKKSLSFQKKFLPKGAKIVVIDDCSNIPVKGADYRFEHNAGIASAKNKCIELLDGCEHIFLFDEDAWPIDNDWHLPYIKSGDKHLSFTFLFLVRGRQNGSQLIGDKHGINEYQ